MSIWARIIVTILMMVVISFLAGALWNSTFHHPIPAYAAGLIGGLVAVPVWEILKKFKPKAPQ
jgi:undecaprenyl pyrophosphate phosphatase UppP